ncbi:hypothetical protein Taro_051281, partial [Colocasia esculenta]|nr:hypothetical protein [Colocasia esculenta]
MIYVDGTALSRNPCFFFCRLKPRWPHLAPSIVSKMSSKNLDFKSSSSSSTSATTGAEQLCYIPCSFCSMILAVSVPCSSLSDFVTVRCGHCSNLWSVNMGSVLRSLPTARQHQQQQLQLHHHHHHNQNWDSPQPQLHPQMLQHEHRHLQRHHHHHQDLVCSIQGPSAITAIRGRQDLATSSANLVASGGCNKFGSASMKRKATIGEGEIRASMTNRLRATCSLCFNNKCRAEIQRIKANNPEISHKESFSTAAKNVSTQVQRIRTYSSSLMALSHSLQFVSLQWAHFPHIQFSLMLGNSNQDGLMSE